LRIHSIHKPTVSSAFRTLLAAARLLCLVGSAFAARTIVRDLPPGLNIPTAAQRP
jgi:hypothetical protein